MKARSKAQKRAGHKRGRKLLPIQEREPNGRRSRRQASSQARSSDLEHFETSAAILRRIAHYGIEDQHDEDGKLVATAAHRAADPRHGYLLGRLLLDGQVTENQHEAGIRYAKDMARFYALTGVPFPSARAQNLFAVRGEAGESESRTEAAKHARSRKMRLQALLMECGGINVGRKVETTVNAVCVLDIDELRNLNPLQKAWLKQGLNMLARYYQIEKVS